MLQRHYRLSALTGTLTLLLTACSGGGSDRPSMTDMGAMNPMGPGDGTTTESPFPVNPARARTLTGAGEPDFADADVAATLEERLEAADSLLVSELRAKLADATVIPVPSVCSGPTCAAPTAGALLGTELTLSVSDLGYADADRSGNARYEAVASHRGVSVAQGRGVTTFAGMSVDRYGFGGWLDHSFFVVETGDVTDGPTLLEGAGLTYGYSLGTAAGSNPTPTGGATGGATWSGVMVGMDAMGGGAPVQGDAEITIEDLSNPMVDVEFSRVRNLVAGTSYDDMSWTGMRPTQGRFEGGAGTRTIQGQFYGADHQEVGGTFTHDSILGAFGAGR